MYTEVLLIHKKIQRTVGQKWVNFIFYINISISVERDAIIKSNKQISWVVILLYIRYFVNSSLPGQNGRHFTDNIFKFILMNNFF